MKLTLITLGGGALATLALPACTGAPQILPIIFGGGK